MRVALLIEQFNPARGGRERSTAEIAEGLVARGCEVDVVCMAGSADLPGVRVVELPARGLGRTHRLARFVRAVQRHTADSRYDITHAMFPVPGADIYQCRGGTMPGLRAAHLRMVGGLSRRVRRVTWPMNCRRSLYARLERQVIDDERTMCLPVSEMVADEIQRYYGRTAGVCVVFNGAAVPVVDALTRQQWRSDVRAQWGVTDTDVVLVCPAMNFDLKGVGQLLEAFGHICWRPAGNGLRLVVLGSDSPPSVRAAGVPSDTVGRPVDPLTPAGALFRPAVDDIWPVYAAADGVALLSWYDACSRVVLEAVGFDVPCLTTRSNGAATLLTGGAGWVVSSPAAGEEVVAALVAMNDAAALASAAAACRRAAPRAAMSRHVDELMDVYRQVRRS